MTHKYLNDIPVIKEGEKIQHDSYYMMDYGVIYFNGHLHINNATFIVCIGWFSNTTDLIKCYEEWKIDLGE